MPVSNAKKGAAKKAVPAVRPARKKRIVAPEALAPYSRIAEQYARDIVSGAIDACQFIRTACQQHLDDLEAQKRHDYPYRYDYAKAERVCRYIECYPHIKGEWASRGERLKLTPWMVFMTCRLFGMVDKVTGLRRFTEFYAEIPRKNAKTTWAAAVGHYLAFADGEYGAEVYCGASTERQAMEVFGTARRQILQTPEAQQSLGIEVAAKSMFRESDNSKMMVLVGNPGDGTSPSAAILDELHEHKSPALRDAMLTGMGARRQPLLVQITTAGVDMSGVCYEVRKQAVRMLKGVQNDLLFAMIYTIDEGDDPLTEKSLRKCNPNAGVSVYVENLIRAMRIAINNPFEVFMYMTKRLNIWGQARGGYFNPIKWAECVDPSLQIFDEKGNLIERNPGIPERFLFRRVREGEDLAARLDLASRVKVFDEYWSEPKDGRPAGVHYFVFGQHYTPRLTAYDGQHASYAQWVQQGWITAHDGAEINLDSIEADIIADLPKYDYRALAFDQAFAAQMQQRLQQRTEEDVVQTIPQTPLQLDDPMKELQAAIVAGRVHHNGDPVLAWCIGNVVAATSGDKVKPDKSAPENKIDAASAFLNAMNRVLAAIVDGTSVYEQRGVVTI